MNTLRKLLVCVLVCALGLYATAAAEGETTITILGTSDLHGNIWGYSYEDNTENTNRGMAAYTPTSSRCVRRTPTPS